MPNYPIGIVINAKNAAQAQLTKYTTALNSATGAQRRMILGGIRMNAIGSQSGIRQRIVLTGVLGLAAGLIYASGKFEVFRESAQVAFTSLLGDAQKGTDFYNTLYQLAQRTPFEATQFETAGQQLVAFGFNAEGAASALKDIADAVSSVPGQADTAISAVAGIFARMKEGATVSLGDISAIEAQGIPALNLLAESYGHTSRAMRIILSRNVLLAADVLPRLQSEFKKHYGGLAALQQQTLGGVLVQTKELMIANLTEIMLPILISLRTTLFYINNGINTFYNWWKKLPGPIQAVVGPLNGVLGVLLLVVGAISAFGVVAAAFTAGWTAIVAIAGGVVTAIGAIVAIIGAPLLIAIAAAIAIVGLLYLAWTNNWLGIQTITTTVWNSVSSFLTNEWNTISANATTIWNSITSFLTDRWNTLSANVNTIFGAIGNFLNSLWNSPWGTIQSIWNGIVSFLIERWNTLSANVSTIFGGIVSFLSDRWTTLSTNLSTIWNTISTAVNTAFGGLSDFFTGIWIAISGPMGDFWNGIVGFFDTIWISIGTDIGTFWNSVVAFFVGIWNNIGVPIGTFWNGIVNFFSGIWTTISTGVSTGWSSITTELSGIWTSIGKSINDFFTNNISPVITQAEDFGKGIINGIVSGIKSVNIPMPTITLAWSEVSALGQTVVFPSGLNIAVNWESLGQLVGLATGGLTTSAGAFMVGEHGPEIANLPAGTAVTPLGAGAASNHFHMEGAQIYGMDQFENVVMAMFYRAQRRGRI